MAQTLVFFFLLASWAAPARAFENFSALDALNSRAQDLGIEPDSLSEDIPQASPTPVESWHPVVEDDNNGGQAASPSSKEELSFWERLQKDVFDDLCRNIKLSVKQKTEINNLTGVSGRVKRSIKRYPDSTLALVDELKLKLSLGHTEHLLDISDNLGISISAGARLEGGSMVVRPTGGKKSCKEALKMLNVFKFKTIIPLSAKRISKMEKGELWKIPVVIWTGFRPTVGGGYGNVFVSVSFGVSNERLPTVSLYRMAADKLRMRLRIDQAVIRTSGISVNVSVAPVVVTLDDMDTALQGSLGELVGQTLSKEIAREFKGYVYARFGLTHTRRKGKTLLVEYILDPRDTEQMKALIKLLRDGEIDILRKLARMASGWNFLPGHNNIDDVTELHSIQNDWGGRLNTDSSYTGVNGYDRESSGFHLHLPIIFNHGRTNGLNYERIYSSETDGGIRHVHQAYHRRSSDFLDIPWFGKVTKHNTDKRAYVITDQSANGSVSSPMLVYQHIEGTVRHSEDSARRMLEEANDIMRYAGVKGEGENPLTSIPLDIIQPRRSREIVIDPFTGEETEKLPRTYKSAMMNFMLAFNENAVSDMLTSAPALVIKSFVNSLERSSKVIMQKVLSMASIKDDGSIKYSYWKVERALGVGWYDDNEDSIMDEVRCLCRKATQLVRDLVSICSAPTWKERSERLAKLIGGKSKSRLGYSKVLKVLVQLVSPDDITAVMTYKAHKKIKGEDDVSVNYEFNRSSGTQASLILADFRRERARFATPSTLSD